MKRSAIFAFSAFLVVACGKKGPPLPPLVKLPAAPTGLAAVRRGTTVTLEFATPLANTDSSRPANVTRVDVYALDGPATMTVGDLLQRGVRVESVAVKAPRDPNLTTEPDDPEDTAFEPPEGKGIDQGAVTHFEEALATPAVPALPAGTALVRGYVAVGVAKNGRRGLPSAAVVVPLVPAPPAPATPQIAFDERAVTLTWSASAAPMAAYHVYETPDTKLTKTPLTDLKFSDPRMDWGKRRCYAVRTVLAVDKLAVESEASAPVCVTLADTFPPAAPRGLTSVGTDGAISLIWDANTEPDLDGYIVLRGLAAGGPQAAMNAITPAPIRDTTFRDTVQAGIRYVYAVQAVDKAGNASQSSARVEEAAR